MPALTAVNIKTSGDTAVSRTTLDGADTFTVSQTENQSLIVENDTGASITFTMIGASAPATYFCQGVGNVAVAAESVTVADGAVTSIYLSPLRIKLAGGTTITGGTGLKVMLVTY